MNKFLLLLPGLLVLYFISWSQVIPAEGDTINYRLTGFSVPTNSKAVSYRFEIALGINNNEVFFNKNLIIKTLTKDSRIIETLPSFNKSYTWRAIYIDKKNKTILKTPLYHFTIGYSTFTDTGIYRLSIINNKIQDPKSWVLSDGNKCMYDIQGDPVWYLPAIPGRLEADGNVRDLKITKDNTLTFLSNHGCYEIDYDGNVLWHTPDSQKTSPDGSVFFHHEFTKLSNGHYMAAGKEEILQPVPNWVDSTAIAADNMIVLKNGKYYKRITSGTLVEYDAEANIVWQLKPAQYFTPADYFSQQLPSGKYISETHFNSFYLDEKQNLLYLSFRNLNRVLKVKYPGCELVAAYGGIETGDKTSGNSLPFRSQHCVRADEEGHIYLLNNGTEKGKGGISSVIVFNNDLKNKDTIIKQWEFFCDIDNYASHYAQAGGSVYKLINGSMLTAMGNAGRIFIVSAGKEVLWNAVAETHRGGDEWRTTAQYRASPIETIEQLEKLIFNNK